MNTSPYFEKLMKLLRVRGLGGGLEITDTSLRFAWRSGGGWRFAGVRLPQGVVRGGELADPVQFAVALANLKEQITGSSKKGGPIHTILALGSTETYVQVFNLPMLDGSALEEAVMLNIKMLSPVSIEKSYAGWQIVGRDEKSHHLEILSAFIERAGVDNFIAPLKTAGFIVAAAEPVALALSRTARTLGAGFDATQPIVIVSTDDNGLSFLVLRGGMLYFQYVVKWSEIQGDGREISWEVFSGVFTEHFRKVINFYGTHWTGMVTEVFMVVGALEASLTDLIATQFQLTAYPLHLTNMDDVQPEWFNALGSGLRSEVSLHADTELSLLGVTAHQEFIVQQARRFMRFWRIVFPLALVILLGIGIAASRVVDRNRQNVEARARVISNSEQAKEILALKEKAKNFNSVTEALATVTMNPPIAPDVERVKKFLNQYDASFTKLSIARGGQVSLDGRIPSEEKLLALADAFRASTEFLNFDIPLQRITTNDQGVSFSITFTITSSKTP